MAKAYNLVKMGECGPCERPECASVFVDVITVVPLTNPTHARKRLGKSVAATVWQANPAVIVDPDDPSSPRDNLAFRVSSVAISATWPGQHVVVGFAEYKVAGDSEEIGPPDPLPGFIPENEWYWVNLTGDGGSGQCALGIVGWPYLLPSTANGLPTTYVAEARASMNTGAIEIGVTPQIIRYDWTLTGHAITDEPIAWPDEAAEYDAAAAAQAWMQDVCQESEGTLLGVIPLHYREAFGARTSGCTAAVVEIALLHSLSVTGDVIAWALAVDDGGWSGDFRGGAVQGNIAYVLTNATVREETDGFSPLVLPSFWSVGSPGGGGSYGVLDSAGSGNGPKILEVRAAGLDVNPTTWLDLSTELSEALWMIRDDDRECWWVWGLTAADDELCILHIDDSQVVEQVAVLPGESGLQVAACTRLSSGLWCAVAAKDDEPERILRYRYGASEFDIVLEKGSAVWPFVYPTGPTGRLWHYGVGAAFFVGSVETCDTTCVCLVEDNEVSTPWMDIGERIFPDPPYEDMNAGCGAGPAVPRPAACCGWTVSEEGWVPQFRNASCLFIFPYEITLCELRELAEIVVQGPVTAVRINDVPIASITDWSEVPLTGEISFRLGSSEVCGPKSGTVIITLIDSEGCCSRHTREVECCQCCPPSGGVSIASDVAESWAVAAGWAGDTSVFACDNTGGGDGCISGCRNYWEWYEMTFNAASLTDCGELVDDDTRACYFIDWGGAEPRDGEILPGMMQPGGTVRFRVKLLTNDDSTPNPVCIRVWVGDALAASSSGDEGCMTFVGAFSYTNLYVRPPGTDISGETPSCVQDKLVFWDCTEENGGQYYES